MFIASFPAGPWQTNCYVIAPDGGRECVIVDPGVGAAAGVREVLAEHDLTPVGVIATHGHIDHVYDVAELTHELKVPVWIHPADEHLLTDPVAGTGPMGRQLMLQLRGELSLDAPAEVHELVDGATLSLAGLDFALTHAPGHTAGCVLLETAYAATGIDRVIFTGDVLFAGSIGRTDLPGGDHDVMMETLRTRILPLADTAALLPGHGGQTTMARERATNPYLQNLSK